MNQPVEYDVVIVGSGLVGLTLALLLCKTKLRCLLIDQCDAPNISDESEPAAVSAINYSQWQTLIDAGLAFSTLKTEPIQRMQVWEINGTGAFTLDAAEMGLEAMAYMASNLELRSALLGALNKSKCVDFLFGCAPERLNHLAPDSVELVLNNKISVLTKLVVGADGRSSRVRAMASIDVNPQMQPEAAFVATLEIEKSHDHLARQVFLQDSVLAFLPLNSTARGQHQVSIVWSGPRELIKKLTDLPVPKFLNQLSAHANTAPEGCLNVTALASDVVRYPIIPQLASCLVSENVVLVGDAAHTLHPLAGQGANLGIADASVLASHLLEGAQLGVPPADPNWLRRYERKRWSEIRAMSCAIKAIRFGYGLEHWLVSLLRNESVKTFESTPALKHFAMAQVQGLGKVV